MEAADWPEGQMEPVKTFEDDPDPDATDRVKVNCPMTLEEADEASNEVTEWMRCRDGIDTAEIALKGFCDEIGANMTKGRIQALCRELQDLVHTHYGMGD
jgi:hypothetical protein